MARSWIRVQDYIKSLRDDCSAIINTRIDMAVAEGVVKSHDSNLLLSSGGHRWLLSNEEQIPQQKCLSPISRHKNFDINTIVQMEEIPKDLISNWDNTGINYVPVGN